MSQPLLDHGRLGRDGPQHCRVLGGVEAAYRLDVADEDVAVVGLGDAVAEGLERLDRLADLLLEHGAGVHPQAEVAAPQARRHAKHVLDLGHRLDVGVDVERDHGVLVPEDRLQRLDVAAVADPLRREGVAQAVERDQLVVGAHEAVGLRERLERPADVAGGGEGAVRPRHDVAVREVAQAEGRRLAEPLRIDLVELLQEGEQAHRVDGDRPQVVVLGVLDEGAPVLDVCHGVPDRDEPRLEVDVAPAQAADLADAHPGVQGEHDRPPEGRVRHHRRHRVELRHEVGAQRVPGPGDDPGREGAVERVPPDRVVAPLEEHGVEPLAELEGLVERVGRGAQGDPAPRPRVDVVGRHLVDGDEAELVALDVQGAVVVVVAGRRGDPVHLQAEVDELLERLGERQRGVVVPLFGGKPGADSGPRLLDLGELQLDLRPEFREDAHRRRLPPRALLQAGHAGVLGPLDLLPSHLVGHRHDGLPLALVLPHAAGSAYA